jgi:hypothetical protein
MSGADGGPDHEAVGGADCAKAAGPGCVDVPEQWSWREWFVLSAGQEYVVVVWYRRWRWGCG